MNTEILVTLISSGCILLGTIITVVVANSKTRAELYLKQKYQQEQIDEVKEQLKQHNGYAVSIPLIQLQIETIKNELAEIKDKIK